MSMSFKKNEEITDYQIRLYVNEDGSNNTHYLATEQSVNPISYYKIYENGNTHIKLLIPNSVDYAILRITENTSDKIYGYFVDVNNRKLDNPPFSGVYPSNVKK